PHDRPDVRGSRFTRGPQIRRVCLHSAEPERDVAQLAAPVRNHQRLDGGTERRDPHGHAAPDRERVELDGAAIGAAPRLAGDHTLRKRRSESPDPRADTTTPEPNSTTTSTVNPIVRGAAIRVQLLASGSSSAIL